MRRPLFLTLATLVVGQTRLEDRIRALLEGPCNPQDSTLSTTPKFIIEEFNDDNRCYLYRNTWTSTDPSSFSYLFFDEERSTWVETTGFPTAEVPADGVCDDRTECPSSGACSIDPNEAKSEPNLAGTASQRERMAAFQAEDVRGIYFGIEPPERATSNPLDLRAFHVLVPSEIVIDGAASDDDSTPSTIQVRETWRDYFASIGYEGSLHVSHFPAGYEPSTDAIASAYEAMLCGDTPDAGRPASNWWTDGQPRRIDFITDFARDPEHEYASWNALRKTIDSMMVPAGVEVRLIPFGQGTGQCTLDNRQNFDFNARFRTRMLAEPYRPRPTDYENAHKPIIRAPTDESCDSEEDAGGDENQFTIMQCLKKTYENDLDRFNGEVIVLVAVGNAPAGDADEDTLQAIQGAGNTVRIVPMVVNVQGPENRCAMEQLLDNLGGETDAWVDYDGSNGGWFGNGVEDLNKGPVYQYEDDISTTLPIKIQTVVRDVWSLGKYIGYLSLVLICSALVVILIILFIRWWILRKQFARRGQPFE